MAGPTPISPEEWQKLYPDAPTETPVERIGQGLGKAWDFMFGRDPSMVNGQPTPQQEQAPQLATAPSPAPISQGNVLLEQGQSPFTPSAPAPAAQGQQSGIGDINLLPPLEVQDQTALGPMEMTLPSATPTTPSMLTVPTPASQQFADAGIPQQQFDPNFLSTQGQPATVPAPAPQMSGVIQKGGEYFGSVGGQLQPITPDQFSQFQQGSRAAAEASVSDRLSDPTQQAALARGLEMKQDVQSMAAENAMRQEAQRQEMAAQERHQQATLEARERYQRDIAAGVDPAVAASREAQAIESSKPKPQGLSFEQQMAARQQGLREEQFEATQANINREWEAGKAAKEAEAQIAEAKAQAARKALQDPNLSDFEKIQAQGDSIGMPGHLIRQGQAKAMKLDLLDDDVRAWIAGDSAQIPQGGEEKPNGETQGSTPATSTFTKDQESTIEKVMKANPNSSRDEVIKALKDAGKL